jgi:NADH-quinone oxidoreductase subunit M
VIAVTGVVLGALYMLRLALKMLFGEARAPHQPLADLNARESVILVALVVAIFALGLYPEEPLSKTELAAREYQQLVMGHSGAAGRLP